jgi:hypothetical protein
LAYAGARPAINRPGYSTAPNELGFVVIFSPIYRVLFDSPANSHLHLRASARVAGRPSIKGRVDLTELFS